MTNPEPSFLKAKGEMAQLTGRFDWAKTPVGPIDSWPQSLKTTVSNLLHSQFPMFLWWGKDMVQFYNDAYRPSMGNEGKHPLALGQKGIDCWPEIWPVIFPLIEQVRATGEPVWMADQLIPIYRNGRLEDVYWTFSYSQVLDDQDRFGGVLVTCMETTGTVIREQNLKENEKQLNFVLQMGGLGFWQLDLSTFELKTSDLFGSLLGKAASQPLSYSIFQECIHPDDRQKQAQAMSATIETGHDYDIEYRILRSDRSVCWLHERAQLKYNRQGQPDRLIGVAADITDHKQTEALLKKDQQDLLKLFAESPVAIATIDKDNLVFTSANPFYGVLVGRDPEQLIGKSLLDALPEIEGQGFDHLLKQVIDTGKPFIAPEVAVDLLRKGRMDTIYVDLTYQPRIGAEGQVFGILVIATDVTGQVLARKKVEESEAAFRTLLENTPDVITRWDRDRRLLYANTAFESKTGQPNGSLLGKTNLEMGQPESIAVPYMQALQSVLDSGQSKTHYNDFPTSLGVLSFYSDMVPETGPDGEVDSVLAIAHDITEQLRAQKEVAVSEAKLKALIAAAPIAIGLFMGRDLVIEYPNQEFIEIVGKGPDIAGKRLVEVMPELIEHGQPYLKILDDVFTSGKMYHSLGDPVNIVRHGVIHHGFYNIYYVPLFDSEGKVYGIMDIATEVTEQVRTQQQLTEKSRELELALRIGDLGSFRIDLASQTGFFSQNIRNWFGFDTDQASMDQISNQVYGPDQVQVLEALADSVAGEHNGQHDLTYRITDPRGGQLRHLHSVGKVMFEDGKPVSILGIIQDVTGQVTSRQALEEKEGALLNAIDLAELGTWRIELTGRQLEQNRMDYSELMAAWFGLPSGSSLDQLFSLLTEQEAVKVKKALTASLPSNSRKGVDLELVIVHPITRRSRIFHLQGSVMRDPAGNPLVIEGATRNITVQRELQLALGAQVQLRSEELAAAVQELAASNEELRSTNEELFVSNSSLFRSNEELSQYAYVASHDLQEPLRKIQVFSNMLAHSNQLAPTERTILEKIVQSANRMKLLIQDLLAFSRLAKGGEVHERVDLNAIVGDIEQDFELLIAEKKAVIQIGKLPVIHAVRLQMNQLFYNLVSNALKFTDPERTPLIGIDCQILSLEQVISYIPSPMESTVYYRITISDNGIGFEPEYARQIFEVFKRLHDKDSFAGTGIGLALCQRIVTNHSGMLFADSESGNGARFTLILPSV